MGATKKNQTYFCVALTPNKVLTLAQGNDPSMAKDLASAVLEKVRGLATSQNGALPSGGFTVVDALVPISLLNKPGTVVTKNVVSQAAESIAVGLRSMGVDKPLVNLYKVPESLSNDIEDVIIQFSEDQPGTNILIVSTDDVETHSKRVIMSNPDLKAYRQSICLHSIRLRSPTRKNGYRSPRE